MDRALSVPARGGPLRIGMPMTYSGGFAATADVVQEYEAAGLDVLFVSEAYSFDAVSQLGYIAARTTTLELAASVLNIYSRTPALLAMTAAGLDHVSGGRFTLGIGASGPQVVEGFHGLPYAAPLARTREVVDICRTVWRREPLDHDGPQFQVPLRSERGGSGLGKPLKLINRPVRARVPLLLAALGPKNVALAAELFELWEPFVFFPEGCEEAFGAALAEGLSRRDPALGPLQIVADTSVLVTDDAEQEARALQRVREHLALYVGGMGAKGRNFYNDLVARFGFGPAATEVQNLFLAGRRAEAAAALPEALVRGVSLVGPRGHVAERLAAFREAGATTLNATVLGEDHASRLRSVAALKDLAS